MADFSSTLDVEQSESEQKLILTYYLEAKSGSIQKPVFTIEEFDVKGVAAAGFMRVQPSQMHDGDKPGQVGFKWLLDENTVKVVVRAYDGLDSQEVDNPGKRVFEDTEELNVNAVLNKGKTVFKVKPAADTVADAKIVAFSGVSTGKGQQLPGVEGSWHKLGEKGMVKYATDGKVFTPSKPVTLSWQIEGADAVEVDLDLAGNGIGKLDIPSTEKDRKAYLTKLTRDGKGTAQLNWLHTNTAAGGGLFVDLNLYDPANPKTPLKTWVVGGYPDYPLPQIVSFAAIAPGDNQTVTPDGKLKFSYELTDTAIGCSFWAVLTDDGGNVIDRVKLKDHGKGPNKDDSKTYTLDPAKFPDGKKITVQAALLTVKRSSTPPAKFDIPDDAGSMAASPSASFGITVKAAVVPAVVPPFVYTPIPIYNMWSAKNWDPTAPSGTTGTQANNVVNQTYERLNNALLDYMGGPPWVANWFTFGKWASREAGQGIKNLSAGAAAMYDLIPSTTEAVLLVVPLPTGETAIYIGSHAKCFIALAEVISDDSGGMFLQVIHLLFTTLDKMPIPSKSDVLNPIWQAKFVYQLAKHRGAVIEIWQKMCVLLKVLVHGNQGIYRNMAWATHMFLLGESGNAGQGMQKLEEWCAVTTPSDPHDLNPRDPQRFLRDSFAMYVECRKLWIQSLSEPDATRKKKLLDDRRLKAHAANVTIGCQEQMLILQSPDVFSNAVAQEIVAGQEGVMCLHDPGPPSPKRRIALLPDPPGGNWADFPVRMGIEPGSGPISVTVANPYPVPSGATFTASSSPTVYVPKAAGSRVGTIYTYFEDNVDDGAGGSAKTPLMTVSMGGFWDNVDIYPAVPGRYI